MSRFEDYIKIIAPNIHIPSYAKRFENIVEVVRCKDCKWRIGLRCYHKRFSMDDLVGENDYCSWGERREDGNNDNN